MEKDLIVVRGGREHNLQNVHLELPRNKLIVFTGVSGSGKSSLAFDTLYAEGQRRYIESLSSYARQFLGQLPKPDVDYIGGLSPSISIQQKTAGRNPRSTVGTITEVFDFLRVLYARIGQGHCPKCGRPITAQSREQIINRILAQPSGTRFLVLAPVVRGQKGEFKDLAADMLKRGFVRARVDGQIARLDSDLKLDKRLKHDIAIVVDRLSADPKNRTRLAEAVEQALGLANGSIIISFESDSDRSQALKTGDERTANEDLLLSAHYACLHCEVSYEEPSPQLFSFNSPHGMCLDCDGLGTKFTFDPDLLVPNPELSFYDGAVAIIGSMKQMGRWRRHIYEGVAKTLGIDVKRPWKKLSIEHRNLLLDGSGDQQIVYEYRHRGGIWKHAGKWEGIIPQLLSSFKKAAGGPRRLQLEQYMHVIRCPACDGQRLNPQARAVRVSGWTLVEACAKPISELAAFFAPNGQLEKKLDPVQRLIANELLKEIRSRLEFLLNVGLHYLTLDRSAPTLSGGEAQRIRLAGQIGSGLVGVLYILDEPSIGLHPRDNDRLLASLKRLRDIGNTVLVVEHDEETMRAADFIVDFGPGPGVRGGHVVASGLFDDISTNRESLTGQYLSGRRQIEIPKKRRTGTGQKLRIKGARHHNLKNIDVEFPLGTFLCVTGVSGSGKSSLVSDILLTALRSRMSAKPNDDIDDEDDEVEEERAEFDRIDGVENLDKVIAIDQSPIGRTPRSNPATYIKVFDEIRSLYATVSDAKVRGYQPGRFSFNKPGGRCESCEGNGSNKLEMDFLADVWVTCPVCDGRRFKHETLQVRYRGKSIHDVLEMDVQDALFHFEHVPKIRAMLQTLHEVGLDYIKLGQPSPTLSGGEAQRIKLARELCRQRTGKTLYILDEPTTGLHFEDVRKLLEVLHRFVDEGNSVIVIEHNLDVIKTADWIIDLGPEGGAGGGEVVIAGHPEEVAKCNRSFTGQALATQHRARVSHSKSHRRHQRQQTQPERITEIHVEGAQQHNLKNINVRIPRERMTVCTGPSGSGKSSLAIDTVYAEGQRRYVESLSSYARQFLGQVQKPKVERIDGLSPAISIEQKTTSKSPRSTVGTVTEIYDYMRVLYARLSRPFCPKCQVPIGTQTSDEIIDKVMALPDGAKCYVLAPIVRRGQEKLDAVFAEVRRAGFTRVRIDGSTLDLDSMPAIDLRRKHEIEVLVDRLVIRSGQRTRITDAIEQALSLGNGVLRIAYVESDRPEPDWRVDRFSQHLSCDQCGRSLEQLNPHHFSFNSPLGWCPSCEGLGTQSGASVDLLIRDPKLSLRNGCIAAWPPMDQGGPFDLFASAVAKHGKFSLDSSFADLEPRQQRMILFGTGETFFPLPDGAKFQYKGLIPALDEARRVSFVYRQRLEHLLGDVPCSTCHGARVREDAAAARFFDKTIGELCDLPIGETLKFFRSLKLDKRQRQVAGELLREIENRLQFLVEVGLDYLSLSRPSPTLSGGEAQRIRLASQIGSGLTGVLYVLDEPTIGLHPRDNRRLLAALKKLRDLGNTLLLVEHDREVISGADHLLDFGPGAGERGGEIVAEGPLSQVTKAKDSLTGKYLSGRMAIPIPSNRRAASSGLRAVGSRKSKTQNHNEVNTPSRLIVQGARHHNLKNITVNFPLGTLIAVTGVSGSGKSSLVHEVLHDTLARRFHRAGTKGAAHDAIVGLDQIDKIIAVDQSPIGNTPSSNPATFTGVFDLIRELFAHLPEAKIRGFQPRRFSFNKPGGRCEACEGNGQKKIEMHFLPDVWVECDVCNGHRYNPDTLAVKYKGKSIADVLELRISEALELFKNIPKIRRILQTLADVGLDYVALGQSAPTLSGGEAQRVKLAAELARPQTGRTLYVLDEPTTGLHFDDVRKLLEVLQRLVDLGNTVIVVEHNLDVIKSADWVVDLGPEAGEAGGYLVAEGPPESIARTPTSHTGAILAEVLANDPHAARVKFDPHEAEKKAVDDLEIADVGAMTTAPWEIDGRRWHTKDRLSHQGRPCVWEGAALDWVEREIHKLGTFGPTNWNHRTVIEIAAMKKSLGYFFHGMTGGEKLLRLVFRVKRNTFKRDQLSNALGIRSLNETDDAKAFGDEERVRVANRRGPWQEVTILVHKKSEIDTPAFKAFLNKAADAFEANIRAMQMTPEDVMPWKVNGERWHLGEKGFPPGRKLRWDRQVLPKMLQVIRAALPDMEIKWDVRDAITFRMPSNGPGFARWWTKRPEALECQFLVKKGAFNLSQLDGLSREPQIQHDKGGGDVIALTFLTLDDINVKKLQSFIQSAANSR